ncbi:MAG: DUF1553 domain-containing protein [Acidobacteria bacterium]|nr:DUF1553 domain-containing protein [Acidobacteriota bacterium]
MKTRVLVALVVLVALLAAEESRSFTPVQKRWWAIQPVAQVMVPAVTGWVRNEIDAFVLEKLQAKGLTPSPAASRVTLLRRVTLDMTGLPPTVEEMQNFVADKSTNAWEKVVDRLLASPHYGERWGRHWLDVARYADSDGFKADDTRPHVWRYRDYVIKSFNDDKPYDRFVREQIAGDELYPGNNEALIGVSFNRHFPDEYNAAHIRLRRQEMLNDITDAVGYAFLGVTLACARCHDHKFDPLLHKDYYRLQSFFANTRIHDGVLLDSAEKQKEYAAQLAKWEGATEGIRTEMQALLKPARESFYAERLSRYPEDIQEILTMKPEARNAEQWVLYHQSVSQVTFTDNELRGKLKGSALARYKELETQLKGFDGVKPEPLNVAQTIRDTSRVAPKTFVLRGGAWDGQMEEVQPGFLSILDAKDVAPANVSAESTGRRAVLANWLASASNPLSTRVIVNRVWHYHFGRGIVGTPSDMGVIGERPSHKELLDWLTAKFTGEDGWSLKKLHKRILMSATYQQSSDSRAEAAKVDPENKLLWKFSRRRLEGESIRDSMLAASGMLNTKMGGPGVFPPLPAGSLPKGYQLWKAVPESDENLRRSVYIFVRRNLRYPMFQSFDFPDTHESCARRQATVTPDQALELLNGKLIHEWARGMARRVDNDRGLDVSAKAERALRMAYSRVPNAEEIASAAAFLKKQEKVAGTPEGALEDLCHTLLASNEFLYIN